MINKCKIIIVAALFFGLFYSSAVGAVETKNKTVFQNNFLIK